jgi:hypothetical protein
MYDPNFSLLTMREGKVCNTCVTFVNLMVVNDYGSPDEIASVDLSLLTTLLSGNVNRIVPPRAGFIKPMHLSSCSGFLVNLSKEEVSVGRSLPGVFLEADKRR